MMADAELKSLVYEIRSLERPEWMINSGLSKGVYHDRTPLMTIVLAGTKIRFRQIHPASNSGVTLSFLNDDRNAEAHHEVTTDWAEIVVRHVSVPFLSTPFTDQGGDIVKVEVEAPDGLKSLPFCNSEHAADLFFQAWDSQQAEYALFESTYTKILIPAKDKATLKALHQATGLKSLFDYHDGIFEYFNYLAGLSFNPVVPTDKNIPNRFFMKADKSGPGAAYYGHSWTAQSSDSVANFWLDIRGANWGSIHEIGHGYQGAFMWNSTINLNEVWNNVFAAHYQKKVMGEEFYSKGWLYSGGEERIHTLTMNALANGTVGHDLGLTLYFFLLIFFGAASERSFIEFHKRYRRISNAPGFRVENYPAMDFLSRITIDVANVDVSEFMSLAKASLTPRQLIENVYSNSVPFYPLYLLVDPSTLKPVQTQLGLRSPVDLVSCKQLSVTGLTANVSLVFEPDVYSEVSGMSFLLRDGRGAARVVQIKSPTVLVRNLPLGLYVLQLPSVDGGKYQAVSSYVVVKQSGGSFNCVYEKMRASSLANQVIYLGGLQGVFCRLAINVSAGCFSIDVVYQSPHVYFKDVYARVIVKDEKGNIVFSREMLGIHTDLFSEKVPIAVGFFVELFHKEYVRVSVSNSSASGLIDSEEINIFEVTEQGLVNIDLGTEAGENLKLEIDKSAATFESSPHLVIHDGCSVKHDLRRAINTFAEPVRSQLLERYRTVGFTRPPNNRALLGVNFTWHLQGNSGRDVGYIRMNLAMRSIDLVFYAVKPHEYFASTYLSVMLKSKEGEIIYFQEFRGDERVQESHVRLLFAFESELIVMHRESTRCRIVNNTDQKVTSVAKIQHATFSSLLGISLASYWPAAADELIRIPYQA